MPIDISRRHRPVTFCGRLPRRALWLASKPRAGVPGASDRRIFIVRRHRMTVAVTNETDHPMDLAALNRVIATAVSTLI